MSQIYKDYFNIDGGYIYDGETDKLVQANRCPIDISLRYTCRAIAHETHHYPFTLNTITFSTVYRRDWRKQAAAFDFIVNYHCYLQDGMLVRLRHHLTADMYEEPSPQHSLYMPIIMRRINDRIRSERRYPEQDINSNAFSMTLDFKRGPGTKCCAGDLTNLRILDNNISRNRTYTYLLRKIAERQPEEFEEAVEEILPGWTKSHSALDFFSLGFDLWAIPSLPEVMDMVEQLQMTERWESLDEWYYSELDKEGYIGTRYCYQRKHFFSAAALAIRFLESIPQTQRLLITKLVLNEDRMAVGNPECHIIGLIPFFQDNPKLIIEHRVNLWRNILPKSDGAQVSFFLTQHQCVLDPPENFPFPHQMHAEGPGQAISHFIMHILEALREGVPPKSYSFIFDGEPNMNHATETFKSLMELYLPWLTANTDCVARGLLASPESHDYPLMTSPSTEEIPSSGERSSIIQCNFTLDQPWDYKSIAGNNNENINRFELLENIHRSTYFDDFDEMLDVSNGTVDWMQIKGEYFEMQPLPDISSKETTRALSSGHLKE
ncbi:hypothetical protein IL306_014546 [Fusarium sp. DS 682]|nr:hypothetical protein IL306_014546 [Fusarium sp. DS 682]